MSSETRPRYFVHSLEKGLTVLGAFSKNGSTQSLSEIAKYTGMSLPTAARYVKTLEDLGFLFKDSKDKSYRLSPKILSIGFNFIENLDIRHRMSSHLLELSKQENVDTACAILDQTEVVYIDSFRANALVTLNLTVGSRLPAYCTALGRVIMAYMDRKIAEDVLRASDLQALTPFTVTDKNTILKELDEIRGQGYAYNEQELLQGQVALAVPIKRGQEVEGSFGVTFPMHLMERGAYLEEMKHKLMKLARKVAL